MNFGQLKAHLEEYAKENELDVNALELKVFEDGDIHPIHAFSFDEENVFDVALITEETLLSFSE